MASSEMGSRGLLRRLSRMAPLALSLLQPLLLSLLSLLLMVVVGPSFFVGPLNFILSSFLP